MDIALKRHGVRLFYVALIIAAIGISFFTYQRSTHASVQKIVSGWAWSSNIGWISLSSTNATSGGGNYSVIVDETGVISGWAWSPNIGWISFNGSDTAGCPGTSGNMECTATLNAVTGEINGWARACAGTVNKRCVGESRTDGWDGWISLRGKNPDYGVSFTGVSPRQWDGFAWGGEVVGWISFHGSIGGATSGSGSSSGSGSAGIIYYGVSDGIQNGTAGPLVVVVNVYAGETPAASAIGSSAGGASSSGGSTAGSPPGAGGGAISPAGGGSSAVGDDTVDDEETPIDQAVIGETVRWEAIASGGTEPYTYVWHGTDALTGSGVSAEKIYINAGIKYGTITVTDSSATQNAVDVSAQIEVLPPATGGHRRPKVKERNPE